MTTRRAYSHRGLAHAHRGVILVIALIVLVAMTLGGIAILRSVDSTTLIAGNLAFKQRALHSTDSGIVAARNWLSANQSALNNDDSANGYVSSEDFDWTRASDWVPAKTISQDVSGNVVK